MHTYAEHHINSKLLQRIHAIVEKQRASMKRKGLSENRFPDFPISRPEAGRLSDMAGVKKPRPGWQVDIAHDHDENVTWILDSRSGSYYLYSNYH